MAHKGIREYDDDDDNDDDDDDDDFDVLVAAVMHICGHGINLYHISTQASMDLNCYFREFFRA